MLLSEPCQEDVWSPAGLVGTEGVWAPACRRGCAELHALRAQRPGNSSLQMRLGCWPGRALAGPPPRLPGRTPVSALSLSKLL